MNPFDFNISTRVIFGPGQTNRIADEILHHGNRVLIVYGGGSVKKSGLLETVIKNLKDRQIDYWELPGIKPNPTIQSVREGISICRENNIGFILGMGGGSTIDAIKGMAAGYYYDGDPWDFYTYKSKVSRALPIGTILTLAATGSEMNGNSVISDETIQAKLAMGSDLLRPKFSILDPTLTFTVNAYHTAAGTADIMSHCFEQYFSDIADTYLQDRLTEAIIKTCIEFGPLALKEPENYNARANLMWASSLALNGLLTYGKQGDWATHVIEHQLSAVYDLTHGIGLAIITPHWMLKVLNKENAWKFALLARNTLNITTEDDMQAALEGIERLKQFFNSMGIPASLKDAGIETSPEMLSKMAANATAYGPLGRFVKLDKDAVLDIYMACR